MKELLKLYNFNALGEGFHVTPLPSVQIFKTSTYHPRMPFFYEQGIVFVLQGSENVYWGGDVYRYDPEQYLVLNVALPAECESFGTEKEPVIALAIDIDVAVLSQLISQMNEWQSEYQSGPSKQSPKQTSNQTPNQANMGLVVSSVTPALKLTLMRLLLALNDPLGASVLGPQLLREIYYQVLRSENFPNLVSLSHSSMQVNKIERALTCIHQEYFRKMDVEGLAALVNMSETTFHRCFKQVTACSPVQYLKKVRLTQAKRLLVEENLQVKVVADKVGYESTSQFSREFKRYFGRTPGAI